MQLCWTDIPSKVNYCLMVHLEEWMNGWNYYFKLYIICNYFFMNKLMFYHSSLIFEKAAVTFMIACQFHLYMSSRILYLAISQHSFKLLFPTVDLMRKLIKPCSLHNSLYNLLHNSGVTKHNIYITNVSCYCWNHIVHRYDLEWHQKIINVNVQISFSLCVNFTLSDQHYSHTSSYLIILYWAGLV